ncbi:MAG: hypothetical protein M3536_05880 [Actinomycetota bacterium]|nr:hypothetical protein [Actinomycetota bacterium]
MSTPSDPRVGEIQERLRRLEHVAEHGSSDALHAWAAYDLTYLLAELRARDEALGRVAGVADGMETSMSGSHEFIGRTGLRFNAVERIRAAVTAATGGGE